MNKNIMKFGVCYNMEFLNELGNWITHYKDTVFTALGVGGASGGLLYGAMTYIKGKIASLGDATTQQTNALKSEVEELKKQNELLMDYVKADSEVKAQSNVLSEELKYKFNEIANNADQLKSSIIDKAKQALKDNIDTY